MEQINIEYSNVDFTNIKSNLKFDALVNSDIPALNILKNDIMLNEIINEGKLFAANKKNFVIFGTGGSNLGAKALINILPKNKINNILFLDNIDPISFDLSIKDLNPTFTGFIFISKSGSTPETLSQLSALIEFYEQKNYLKDFFNNCLMITENKKSPLREIAKDNQCKVLDHNNTIGGRFSVFSNVGMIPAVIAGLDVKKIYEGAKASINNTEDKIARFFYFQKFNTLISNSIIMTYSDSLFFFGKWYLQLWAESIGKNQKGITAIHAVGTTDQHSQLQLYLDGPKDKFFTFITTNHKNSGLKMHNHSMRNNDVEYLVNKSMGDLMHAEQQATIDTFIDKKLPIRQINLPVINEFNIGQLMSFSIKETLASCYYFDVDPFNQPAVEQGKILTKQYLS